MNYLLTSLLVLTTIIIITLVQAMRKQEGQVKENVHLNKSRAPESTGSIDDTPEYGKSIQKTIPLAIKNFEKIANEIANNYGPLAEPLASYDFLLLGFKWHIEATKQSKDLFVLHFVAQPPEGINGNGHYYMDIESTICFLPVKETDKKSCSNKHNHIYRDIQEHVNSYYVELGPFQDYLGLKSIYFHSDGSIRLSLECTFTLVSLTKEHKDKTKDYEIHYITSADNGKWTQQIKRIPYAPPNVFGNKIDAAGRMQNDGKAHEQIKQTKEKGVASQNANTSASASALYPQPQQKQKAFAHTLSIAIPNFEGLLTENGTFRQPFKLRSAKANSIKFMRLKWYLLVESSPMTVSLLNFYLMAERDGAAYPLSIKIEYKISVGNVPSSKLVTNVWAKKEDQVIEAIKLMGFEVKFLSSPQQLQEGSLKFEMDFKFLDWEEGL